jgi:hypothetical protein
MLNLKDQVLSGDFTVDRTIVLKVLGAIFVVWVLEKVVGVWIVSWKVSIPRMSGIQPSFHPFHGVPPLFRSFYPVHPVRECEC